MRRDVLPPDVPDGAVDDLPPFMADEVDDPLRVMDDLPDLATDRAMLAGMGEVDLVFGDRRSRVSNPPVQPAAASGRSRLIRLVISSRCSSAGSRMMSW